MEAAGAIGNILHIARLEFIQHFLDLLYILLIELFVIGLALQCATK